MTAVPRVPSVVVVIPTYNERDNLRTLVPKVLALSAAYRVIVVDDDSPDGTGAVADALADTFPGRVEVLHRAKKEGIGRAYLAGFRVALARDADLIAEMDADHSHNPADLPRLVAAAATAALMALQRFYDDEEAHERLAADPEAPLAVLDEALTFLRAGTDALRGRPAPPAAAG